MKERGISPLFFILHFVQVVGVLTNVTLLGKI